MQRRPSTGEISLSPVTPKSSPRTTDYNRPSKTERGGVAGKTRPGRPRVRLGFTDAEWTWLEAYASDEGMTPAEVIVLTVRASFYQRKIWPA